MRYYIECTHTAGTQYNTGIQRVVRNVINTSLAEPAAGRHITPVIFDAGRFQPLAGPLPYPAPKSEEQNAGRPPAAKAKFHPAIYAQGVYRALRQLAAALLPWQPWVDFLNAPATAPGLSRLLTTPVRWLRKKSATPVDPPQPAPAVTFHPGDVLILLDSSWHLSLWDEVRTLQSQGVQVVCIVYDLIPYICPQYCESKTKYYYCQWMAEAFSTADAFLCISQTVAEEIQETLPRIVERTKPLRVNYFWLGSELDGQHLPTGTSTVHQTIASIIQSPKPVYLYVSTIEPRKNHAYALDAFERLWAQGHQAQFVIVGRVGWLCADLIQRVRTHPQYGRQLFMFNQAGDDILAQLYGRGNGLLFTSYAEGFGLPMVEALQRGLPVFASNIPVFRELGAEGVTFVDLTNPAHLANALVRHIEAGAPRLPAPIPWLNWRQSTQQFWDRVDQCLQS